MKTLKLTLNSAKCFPSGDDTDDKHARHGIGGACEKVNKKSATRDECVERDEKNHIVKVRIPDHCMWNAIAVLMGDRPIPRFRKVHPLAVYDNSHYRDMASRAFIDIKTTAGNFTAFNGVKCAASECGDAKPVGTITLDGLSYELYRTMPTFQRIRDYNPAVYASIDSICVKVFGEGYQLDLEHGTNDFVHCVEMMREAYKAKSEVRQMVDSATDGLNKGATELMRSVFTIPVTTGRPHCENETQHKYNMFRWKYLYGMSNVRRAWFQKSNFRTYIQNVLSINADIYVKVTDEEYDQILHNSGVATLMEGGVLAVDWDGSGDNWDSRYERFDQVRVTEAPGN